MEKVPFDTVPFLQYFGYGIAVPLEPVPNQFIRDILFIGYGDGALFQIHHAGNTGNIVDGFGHTARALFAVHTLDLEGLGGGHMFQLLLSGLVIAAAAAAALAAFPLYDGADRN